MARLEKNGAMSYPTITKEECQDPILFVVDMINGFIKEGALHDEAIMACVDPIIHLLQDDQLPAIFIADAHPQTTREFQSFPVHCVKGTRESDVIDELQPYVKQLFHKNSTNTFTCEDFQSFLEEEIFYHQDIIITGCCTDICVLQFALCLNAWLNEHNMEQKRIIVPMDCVETYHIDGLHNAIETNTFALQNMAANGIHVVAHIER